VRRATEAAREEASRAPPEAGPSKREGEVREGPRRPPVAPNSKRTTTYIMGNACDCGMSRGGKALPPAAPAGEQKIASGFRYFAYGSNLCGDRLRMRNKSARLVGTARLDGYRLDFTLSSLTWRGAAADIVADEGGVVWGVVWELDEEDAASLDGQEGVWRVKALSKALSNALSNAAAEAAAVVMRRAGLLPPPWPGETARGGWMSGRTNVWTSRS